MTSDRERTAADAYDELADSYAEDVETNPYHAELAFPGTVALLPDVEGKRVLDAGCGTGVYAEWLLDRGAEVVGVDASEAMLARARERAGGEAEFRRADLGEPLDFAGDGEFDGIVCALALDYVREWRRPFSEFARLLRPGGFVVFSIPHPLDEYPLAEDENYFAVERRTKEWAVDVRYYRRPFSEIVNPVLDAGFRLETVAEPQPTAGFREKWPERYEKESKRPVFLCVRAVRR